MQLQDFYSTDGELVTFTRTQASEFAKNVADDFNPLHDPDAKLFCVPGDLLFAVALSSYGLSKHMRFIFTGMVDGGVPLVFPPSDDPKISIIDNENKTYLQLERDGEISHDASVIKTLICNYVEFSGHAFPHILVPLMAEHNIMINPKRPLVIYESMEIHLDQLNLTSPTLEYTGATLELNGKKGNISLNFLLKEGEMIVGRGAKYMLARGLQPYQKDVVDEVVKGYSELKQLYRARQTSTT